MFTGLAKLPDEFDNWAVNTFPELAGPSVEYETLTLSPAHRVADDGDVVVIMLSTLDELEIIKFTSEKSKKIFPTASTFILALLEMTLGSVMD